MRTRMNQPDKPPHHTQNQTLYNSPTELTEINRRIRELELEVRSPDFRHREETDGCIMSLIFIMTIFLLLGFIYIIFTEPLKSSDGYPLLVVAFAIFLAGSSFLISARRKRRQKKKTALMHLLSGKRILETEDRRIKK